MTSALIRISRDLCREVDALRFAGKVAYVYNPLEYARAPHELYLERYGQGTSRRAVFVGMNPGPFGMAQTGVPFGDIAKVRDYLGVTGPVDKPTRECASRPVTGFGCPRSEVSGTRLWGLFESVFPDARDFFASFFVANWCPLVFMEEGGRNVTPDKLPAHEAQPLFQACDRALGRVVDALGAERVIGVGAFAKQRAQSIAPREVQVGTILHPSPASPAANRDWAGTARAQLVAMGLDEFAV
jgi:single-strand selective monofunctional uracil DNA glycosylase